MYVGKVRSEVRSARLKRLLYGRATDDQRNRVHFLLFFLRIKSKQGMTGSPNVEVFFFLAL